MSDGFDLSRRKLLGSVATLGAAGALGGAGSMAFFSDDEQFANNQLTAGELDMKVAYSEHYSDWMDDEGDDVESLRMFDGAPNETGDEEDLEEDEVGLPTTDNWLIAVGDSDDASTFLENTLQESSGAVGEDCDDEAATDAEDLAQPVIDLEDVKPGDFGEVTFDFRLCDNPGYVFLQGGLVSAAENGTTEPEADDPDEEDGVVELLDAVQAAFWVDDGNNWQNGDEVLTTGSLREVLDLITDADDSDRRGGALLNGDISAETGGGMGGNCFSGGTEHSVGFAWWLPVDHANEIQTDSVTFDLGFYTEQCRHNSGMGNDGVPGLTTTTGEGFVKIEEEFQGPNPAGDEFGKSGGARARYGDDADSGAFELVVGDDPGNASATNTRAQYDWAFGTPVEWTVEYTAADDTLAFTFDSNEVSQSLSSQPQGRIAVQAKADEASVDVTDISLTVDGSDQLVSPNALLASNDGDGREIRYNVTNTDFDGSQDFSLSGDVVVDVQGDYPGGDEDVAFDVVVE